MKNLAMSNLSLNLANGSFMKEVIWRWSTSLAIVVPSYLHHISYPSKAGINKLSYFLGCQPEAQQSWWNRRACNLQDQWWPGNPSHLFHTHTHTRKKKKKTHLNEYTYKIEHSSLKNWKSWFSCRSFLWKYLNGLVLVGYHMLRMTFKCSSTWWAPTSWKHYQRIRRYCFMSMCIEHLLFTPVSSLHTTLHLVGALSHFI